MDYDVGILLCQLIFELQQESARLTIGIPNIAIIDEIGFFRPLQLAIEVIGIHCLFLLIIRKMTFFSDRIGDEASVGFACRENAFVDANHIKGIEVEVTRLQQSHDLHAFLGSAVEFDRRVDRHQTIEHFQIIQTIHVVGITFHDAIQTVDHFAHLTDLVEEE